MVLDLTLAVRPDDGLKAHRDADGEHPDDPKSFRIRTTWRITTTAGVVILRKDTPITHPVQVVRVPKARGEGTRRAILVPVSLTWDGRRSATGGCLPDGAYSWTVDVSFLRLKVGKRKTQEKLLGKVSSSGSVTILGQPPVLTVTSPDASFATRELSVTIAGVAQG